MSSEPNLILRVTPDSMGPAEADFATDDLQDNARTMRFMYIACDQSKDSTVRNTRGSACEDSPSERPTAMPEMVVHFFALM